MLFYEGTLTSSLADFALRVVISKEKQMNCNIKRPE